MSKGAIRLALILAIALSLLARGQVPFSKAVFCPPSEYVSPMAKCVRTTDGGFSMLIRNHAAFDSGCVIMKFDGLGEPLWARQVWSGVFAYPSIYDMAAGPNGSIIAVSGDTITNPPNEAWEARKLVRFASNGDVEWAERIWHQLPDSDSFDYSGPAMDVDDNGNIFLSAYDTEKPVILKFDADGDLQWGRLIIDNAHTVSELTSLKADGNGGCYFTAFRFPTEVDSVDRFVFGRLQPTGNLLFCKQVQTAGSTSEYAYDLGLRSDGSLMISGHRNLPGWSEEAVLLSASANGSIQWIRSYQLTSGGTWFYSTVELNDHRMVSMFQTYSQALAVLSPQGLVQQAIEAVDYDDAFDYHIHGWQDLIANGDLFALGGWHALEPWSSSTELLPTFWQLEPDELQACGIDTVQLTSTDITSGHTEYSGTATTTPVVLFSADEPYYSEPYDPFALTEFCSLFMAVEEGPAQREPVISCHPNPMTSVASLKGPELGADRVIWRDMTGRRVMDQPVDWNEGQATLLRQGLPTGIYSVELLRGQLPLGTVKVLCE